jgi:hypothetical protein
MITPNELHNKLKQQVQDNIIPELPKLEGVEYQANCHGMSHEYLNLLDIIIRGGDSALLITSKHRLILNHQEKRYTVLMEYYKHSNKYYINSKEIKNLPEEITQLVIKWRAFEKGTQKLFTKEIYDKEKAIWDKLMIEVPKMGKKVLDLNHTLTIQIDNSDLCIKMRQADWEAKSNSIGQPINKINLRVIEMGKYINCGTSTLINGLFGNAWSTYAAVRPSKFVKKLRELLKQQ